MIYWRGRERPDRGPGTARQAGVEWIGTASDALREVESGMRRNVLRSLALDNFAARLADVGPRQEFPTNPPVSRRHCPPREIARLATA